MLIYPNERWFEHFYSAPVLPYSPSAFSFLAYLKVLVQRFPSVIIYSSLTTEKKQWWMKYNEWVGLWG